MNGMKSEKGQALILLAFGIIALIGFTALAVDGGRVLSDRRQAQNAADTAVLAAALSKINGADQAVYYQKGSDRALDNRYGASKYPNTIVEVDDCGPLKGGPDECKGLPATAVHSEYIRVRITSDVPMTFGRVLGRDKVTNVVEAVARVQGSVTTGAFFGGAGMASTQKSGDQCFLIDGTGQLHMYGSGIFVNCDGPSALFMNGHSDITFEDDVIVAGCAVNSGGAQITYDNGAQLKDCDITNQQDVSDATFASVPTLLPTPNCSGAGSYVWDGHTVKLREGRYTKSTLPKINSGDTVDLIDDNGIYCFDDGLTLNPGVNLHASYDDPDKKLHVKLVMPGSADLSLSGAINKFDDVEIYVKDGDFQVENPSGSFTAERLRFFASGDGNYVQQNGYITSGNAYFYTYGGNFDINSNAILNLHAPPEGDTFGGLLFYKPWGNDEEFTLNGGTNSILYGTILMPSAKVTLNGGSGMEVHGQIIAARFKVNGTNEADVYYDPVDNYNPPDDPTIELTK